jgi:outer membrane protein assembly factor BamA
MAQGSESQQAKLERLRQEKSKKLEPYLANPWENRMRRWEKARMPARIFRKGWAGFRPVIGGMMPGSGTVFGGGYIYGQESQYTQFQVNARYSTKGYTQYDGMIEFPAPQRNNWLRTQIRAAYLDYTQINFFGLGNDTSKDDKSFFRQLGYFVRAGVAADLSRFLEVNGRFERLQTETRDGERDPLMGSLYPGVPGFGDDKNDFNIFGAGLKLKLFDQWDFPPVGAVISLDGARYDDQTLEKYDSFKVVGEAGAIIPLGYRNRRIALRFRTAHMQADSGEEVPFYLMETIGGAKTLRGYSEFRFRDTRNLLLNMEYRWELIPFIDFAFFADTGKVFRNFEDFNLKDLHWGAGWGIRVHAPGDMFFSIDLAGSPEGFVIHLSSGMGF